MFPTSDLWQYLQQVQKPILLYGMGNGADKIHAVCAARGIAIADCFASDEFVRGQLFHSRRVLTYAEAKSQYGSFVVLLAFATARPEVLARIDHIAAEQELYVPDLPACGDTLFDAEFVEKNRAVLEENAELFFDAASRQLFCDVVTAKLNGSLSLLYATASDPAPVWREILHPQHYRASADLGAYTGDTLRELLGYAPNLTEAWAVEPDRRSFAKLCAWGESESRLHLHAYQLGAWNKRETRYFSDAGGRGSTLTEHGGKSTQMDALDAVAGDARIDYIKYDVEGAEYEALLGSRETIARCRPELLVSLYHRAEDLVRLPMLVKQLCPGYRFYLRRMQGLPAWDLNLYAIPEEVAAGNGERSS